MIDQVELMRLILKDKFEFTIAVFRPGHPTVTRIYRYDGVHLSFISLDDINRTWRKSRHAIDDIKKVAISGKCQMYGSLFTLISIGEYT